MLICVYLYFNNLIYQSQTKKKGVRERKNNKSSKHNLTRAKRCLFDISSQEPFIFQEHVILS